MTRAAPIRVALLGPAVQTGSWRSREAAGKLPAKLSGAAKKRSSKNVVHGRAWVSTYLLPYLFQSPGATSPGLSSRPSRLNPPDPPRLGSLYPPSLLICLPCQRRPGVDTGGLARRAWTGVSVLTRIRYQLAQLDWRIARLSQPGPAACHDLPFFFSFAPLSPWQAIAWLPFRPVALFFLAETQKGPALITSEPNRICWTAPKGH